MADDQHTAKVCSACKVNILIEGFYKDRGAKDGRARRCIVCQKAHLRTYRAVNSSKIVAQKKTWYARNAEKQRARVKRWAEDNPDRLALRKAALYQKDLMASRERGRIRAAAWRAADIDHAKSVVRRNSMAWREEHKFEARYQLENRVRRSMHRSLKGTGIKGALRHLDYSLDELRTRLFLTIPVGYTWGDFLAGELHVDHIRPIASFNYVSVEDSEFRDCWSLLNLQLLTGQDNRKKSARLDWTPACKLAA